MCRTILTVENKTFVLVFEKIMKTLIAPPSVFFNFYQNYWMKLRKKFMEEGIGHLRHINTTFYVQIPMALIAPQKWLFSISELSEFTTSKNRWIPSLDNLIVTGYDF